MRLTPLLPLALLLMTGCPGDEKADDSDTVGTDDSDTVGTDETDTDSDTDIGDRTIAGSLDLYVDNAGSVDCDVNVTFTGTEDASVCPDCVFNFDVAATTADEVGSSCYFALSMLEDTIQVNPQFAFDEEHIEGGYYAYYNALKIGASVDYTAYGYGYYAGPYWTMVAFDGSEYGSVTVNGNDVSWSFDQTYEGADSEPNYYYQYCDALPYAYYAYEGNAYEGDWNCVENDGDVWTFDTILGNTTTISIDTVAETTSFDPLMYVIGSDTCLDASADDIFDCTFPPPNGYSCPSVSFEGDGNPVTLIVFGSYYDSTAVCGADGVGAYDLQINNGNDGGPNATLTHDNVALYTAIPFTNVITSSGSATITE